MELKEFLKKTRDADERSKKKLLIIASALVLVVVVVIWLKFFGGFLAVKFPKI